MLDLSAARADLIAVFRAELPERYQVPDYPPKAGDYKRASAVVVVDQVIPAIDDMTDMISAELRLDIPTGVGLSAAYQILDDLVARVDAAMPINWLALDDWNVEQISDPVALLSATCTALGHPTDTEPPPPTDPSFALIGDGPDVWVIGDDPDDDFVRIN